MKTKITEIDFTKLPSDGFIRSSVIRFISTLGMILATIFGSMILLSGYIIISLADPALVRIALVFLFLSLALLIMYCIATTKTKSTNRSFWARQVIKRFIEVLLISYGFPTTIPFMLIVVIIIKLGSRGPAIYRSERLGQYGRRIGVIKFRTKYVSSEPSKNQDNEPFVTKEGAILQRFGLDELPQAFNILEGSMSLIGPRPKPIDAENKVHDKRILSRVLEVPPGITGLAQVTPGIYSNKEKLELDLQYVENWSLSLDFKILIMAIYQVLIER